MSESDARRDPRLSKPLIVRCRAQGQANWFMAPLRDVSHTGARFLCEAAYAPGTILEMQLQLPAVQEPVKVAAVVKWSKPGPMECTEYGVVMQSPDPLTEQMLIMAMQFFLKKRKGER